MSEDDYEEDKYILSLKDVSLSFQTDNHMKNVLSHIDLNVQRGEWISIMGKSGSGKTSLLNVSAGLIPPSSGSVVIEEKDISQLPLKRLAYLRRTSIAVIHQDYLLFPQLTVYENISLPLKLGKQKLGQQELELLLTKLGILSDMDTPVGDLSGGQKQRVAIARALSYSPHIIFVDEPTAALDSDATKDFIRLVRELVTENLLTVILVTHDPTVAAAADYIYFLKDGKLTGKTKVRSGRELATLYYD